MKVHYSDIWREIARRDATRLAVVSENTALDYGAFVAQAGAVATFLRERGVHTGDAVAILSHNRVEYLVTLFACLATGIAPVPINYRYRAHEVAALLRDSDARVIAAPGAGAPLAREAIAASEHQIDILWFDEPDRHHPNDHLFADIVGRGGELPATVPDDAELRLYTGGTTGQPKAVVWGAADILSVQLTPTYGAIGLPLPDSPADVMRVATAADTPRVVSLPVAPFMHGTALFNAMNTLAIGGTVVIDEHPHLDAARTWRLIGDHGVTRIIIAGDAVGVPLVEAAAAAPSPWTLSSILSSGMRLSDETARALHRLGPVTISDIIAATEGGPFAMRVTRSEADVPGTVRLLPGAVLLDAETEVQHIPGAHGVLAFRGTLPRGYWRDPERTARTFPEIGGVRHVMPGDWARALGDDGIELLGRGSAVVNTGGEKVYPAEVESALLAFPGIRDVVVFGLPDERFGQVVSAMVATDAGHGLDREALRGHLDARLAGYKKPRHLFIRDSLHRTPHGKIDMAAVTAAALAELGREA